MYKSYTRRTCLQECKAKIIMEKCGCLPFYFPDYGVVWGTDKVKYPGNVNNTNWAVTQCNHTGYMCLAINAGLYLVGVSDV